MPAVAIACTQSRYLLEPYLFSFAGSGDGTFPKTDMYMWGYNCTSKCV